MLKELQAWPPAKRVIHFWEKYERYITGAAMVLGFIFDLWVAKRPDSLFDNLLLLNYLFIAGVFIIILNLHTTRRQQQENPAQPLLLIFILQFCFGGLSSNLLVLYGHSGTFAGSALFIGILAGMLLGNELFHSKYEQMRFHIGAYYLLLFTYLIISLPTFVIHQIGTWVFIATGAVSLVYISCFLAVVYWVVLRGRQRLKQLAEVSAIVGGIYLIFAALYFLNIIPPVPLSLKAIGIYHTAARAAGGGFTVTYEKPEWFAFWRDTSETYSLIGDNPIAYCFSSVFAPTGLSAPIEHKWEEFDQTSHAWVTRSTVLFPISGGRAQGYRGFTYKAVEPGQWRCDVETESGLLIGRITFTAKAGSSTTPVATATL